MPIAALVVHLGSENGDTLAHLAATPGVSLGERQGALLPVVAESPDARAGEALFAMIRDTPGVQFVDVVMVDFQLDEVR